MEIKKIKEGSSITFFFEGKFTFESKAIFGDIVLNLEQDITNIILDFKSLDNMDSSSIGMLLIFHEQTQKCGIHVCIVNVGANIKPLFEQSVLGKLFEIEV